MRLDPSWSGAQWRLEIRCAGKHSRRKAVRRRQFLSPQQFCRQRGISRAHLVRLERHDDVFAVTIDHKAYYPAVLARPVRNPHRFTKLCHQLGQHVPAMTRYNFLVMRWGSLGGKTPLQALRQGPRYAWTLHKAEGVADDYALRRT
jgi:hypothetical protein